MGTDLERIAEPGDLQATMATREAEGTRIKWEATGAAGEPPATMETEGAAPREAEGTITTWEATGAAGDLQATAETKGEAPIEAEGTVRDSERIAAPGDLLETTRRPTETMMTAHQKRETRTRSGIRPKTIVTPTLQRKCSTPKTEKDTDPTSIRLRKTGRRSKDAKKKQKKTKKKKNKKKKKNQTKKKKKKQEKKN